MEKPGNPGGCTRISILGSGRQLLSVCHEPRSPRENLSLAMDERSSLWSGLLCSHSAPGGLIWYSKYPLIILELEGERERERKGKGERFIYILVARCLWPLLWLLLCVSVCRRPNAEPFLLSPTSNGKRKVPEVLQRESHGIQSYLHFWCCHPGSCAFFSGDGH